MSEPGSSVPGEWELPSARELVEMLPQYDIVDLLGRGGMGAVFKGRQAKLDRDVAIKLLFRSAIESDEEMMFSERFQREAKAMAKLDHPNIVSVFDFGETHDGQLYLVMEFIDGMDIHEYLQHHGGSLPQEHALSITAHVLDALGYAHSRGIVHRDIKPANILLNREGRVKIADFGLAKKFGEGPADSGPALTMENTAVGTPDFVAPEALESGKEIDHRADLYAVGVMLYQMLTGKLPRGVFKMPSELNPELDVRLDAIIEKSLEADPEYRYSSASLVRADIDQIISGPMSQMQVKQEEEAPVAAKPKLVVGSEADAAAMEVVGSSGKKVGKKRVGVARKKVGKKANKAPLFVGAIIAAAILVGVVFMGKNKKREGLSPEETHEPGAVDSTPQEVKDNKPKEPVPSGKLVKPSSQPQSKPALKAKRIDLLAGIDLTEDVVSGNWGMEGSLLVTRPIKNRKEPGVLRLANISEIGEYDVEIRLERQRSEGNGTNLVFVSEGHQGMVAFSGLANGGWFVENIDGKNSDQSPAYTDGHRLEPGEIHDIRVEVRKGRISCYRDNEEMVSWEGDANRLGLPGFWEKHIEDPNSLYLCSNSNGPWNIHKIELIPVEVSKTVPGGNLGKPFPPSQSKPASKPKRIDLLTGIDLKKDVIQGDWEWDGKRLITKNTGEKQRSVRLRKMQIPDEYDLNLHIERLGESGINVVFMMSGQQAVLVLEQWAWFIESIDGKTTKESPAYKKLHTTPGDKFEARLEVRKNGLAVYHNEEEVLSWKGKPDQISISDNWAPLTPENDRLYLMTNGLFAVDKIDFVPKIDSAYSISNPFENSLGMRFVPVPITGGPTGDKDILFSIWETRVKDYQAFVDDPNSKVSKWEIPTRAGNAEQAAGNVTWQRADLFCEWLTEKERRQGLISSNLAYRLPTDHEWSAAAGISNRENVNLSPNNKSEGIKDVYLWEKKYPPPEGAGNYAGRESEEQIWAKDSGFRDDYMDAFSHVAPVGAFQANEAGLFDLGGNVWEWCWDLENARKQQGVARRVRRGGSYRTWNQNELLSSHRSGWGQTNSHLEIGFRVVLGPPLKE